MGKSRQIHLSIFIEWPVFNLSSGKSSRSSSHRSGVRRGVSRILGHPETSPDLSGSRGSRAKGPPDDKHWQHGGKAGAIHLHVLCCSNGETDSGRLRTHDVSRVEREIRLSSQHLKKSALHSIQNPPGLCLAPYSHSKSKKKIPVKIHLFLLRIRKWLRATRHGP